jgi:sigma-B regulation protein RsbU (phosphoserine phosphatase)
VEVRLDPRTREQLVVRRQRLATALASPTTMPELGLLLAQVDAALARMGEGTFGLCETCHDPIEDDRLRVDPLLRYCLDHLNDVERQTLERDLAMAAQVQRALLPRQDLAASGWDVHYHYEALGPVSGDYCDLLPARDEGRGLLFAVGDVSGKGVAASLLSSHLSALFRALDDLGLSVAEIIPRANRLFCESTGDAHYATLVLGRACADGAVELANAAQAPPLLLRGGRVTASRASGLPLGMFCDSPYLSESVQMGPGDCLVAYTDGVSEARSPDGEEFGRDRLAAALGAAPTGSASAAAHACLAALDRFRAGAPLEDDVTLLVLRRSDGA